MVIRSLFMTMSNIYDEDFLKKQLKEKVPHTYFEGS